MKNHNVKIIIVFLSCLTMAFFSLSWGDMLELTNKDSKNSAVIKYEDSSFKTEEGESIAREEVKTIYFSRAKDVQEGGGERTQEVAEGDIGFYQEVSTKMHEKYPDASGLIVYDVGKHTLTKDGQTVYWYHFVGKVLSTDTKNWSDVSLYFEEGQSRAKVIMGRSISPTGEVYDLDTSMVTISEPSRGMVHFGKGKIYSFVIPNVEIGSIVEYIFETVEYAPEDPNLFAPRYFFQSNEPIYVSSIDIEIPADRNLNYITYNFPEDAAEPEITKANGMKTYKWELKNVEPLIEEPYMPAYRNSVPAMFACLYENMDYFYDKFSEFHKKRIEVTPEIEAKVLEVTSGANSIKEKVANLYHYLQRDVRYISVKGSLGSGIAGHPASYTFNNKYGDCIDKAILFASMLKVIGVESYPIIVYTNDAGYLDRKAFPFWGGNHAIDAVYIEGEKYILDATNNQFRFPYYSMGDCDLEYVNYIKREIGYIPPIPPEDNAIMKEIVMSIDKDGKTSMDAVMSFTGNWEAGYRSFFEYTPEGRHEQVFSNWLNSETPGAILDSFSFNDLSDISVPFLINYEYTIDKLPVFAGDLMIFNVPAITTRFPEIALEQRKFNIQMEHTELNSHNVTIEIPDSYKIEYLPPPFEIENKYVSYKASYEAKQGKIIFSDEFRRKTLRIPVSDYTEYKETVEKIMAQQEKQIFLSKL
ncbi:DUF3857 and transglutaminase domain-containing protein [bacterium]|nr:DUF3857 and transglutaminase domain-containing protein [bacterium]